MVEDLVKVLFSLLLTDGLEWKKWMTGKPSNDHLAAHRPQT